MAIQNLPVLFAIDRAGIVGADGPTHQGSFDLSFLRCIPNMVVMAPSDERECQLMLTTGHQLDKPAAVRYPRGSGIGSELPAITDTITVGKGVVKQRGEKIAILSFGTVLCEAELAAKALNATLVDMRFVKPLDESLIAELSEQHDVLVTVEDNAIAGGAGSAVNEYLLSQGLAKRVLNVGLPDVFIKHGTQQEIHTELGLDSQGIVDKINAFL